MISLILGDCLEKMKDIPDSSVDAVITDPPYAEIDREYGRLTEPEWHTLMRGVVAHCRRILKPSGSAVFILQANQEKVGRTRPWLWEFMAWTAREWNQVQDAWWWNIAAPATVHCNRRFGLMRPSLKAAVWLGEPDCYRCQENILWEESQANAQERLRGRALHRFPSGQTVRRERCGGAAEERGGVTPFNVLPMCSGNVDAAGHHGHGAGTPHPLCDWWTRYICPPRGTILDPFMGAGTAGLSALKYGNSYIGIEKHEPYFIIAQDRIKEAEGCKADSLAPPLDKSPGKREPCPKTRIARSSSSSQASPTTGPVRQMELFSLATSEGAGRRGKASGQTCREPSTGAISATE